MAIITCLNIAFAILKLSRFLTNPNPTHIQAANKVINYLLGTRTLRLKFEGGDELKIVINTSFINNTNNKKTL